MASTCAIAAAQVQFHPESVATQDGIAVLQNFRDLTLQHLGQPPVPPLLPDLRGELFACSLPRSTSVHLVRMHRADSNILNIFRCDYMQSAIRSCRAARQLHAAGALEGKRWRHVIGGAVAAPPWAAGGVRRLSAHL